jgi:hypothetical protein
LGGADVAPQAFREEGRKGDGLLMPSKSQQALRWIAESPTTRNAWQAAKRFSLSPSTVYRAIARAANPAPRCPCCGQLLPLDTAG